MYMSDSVMDMRNLMGKPIVMPELCLLKPKTIDEIGIDSVGFDVYNQYLSTLCIAPCDIYELLDFEDEFENVNPYDFILSNCLASVDFCNMITDALSFFTNEQVGFAEEGIFYIDHINSGKYIYHGNYSFLVDILKRQNCIGEPENANRAKPKNDAQKQMYRDLAKARTKYSYMRSGGSDMTDIISSVCCKHPSINLFNVGRLTIYQLIDSYKRLNAIDEYFVSIKSLLAGASGDDVKVVHWSAKMIK